MALFELPSRVNKDKALVEKASAKSKTQTSVRGGSSIIEKISSIKQMVERNLGVYKDLYTIVDSKEHLHELISTCISSGICAIDTETTGLDPIEDKIIGFSISTRACKGAYIPVHHKSYITLAEVPENVPVDDIREELQRLVDNNVKIIMFNAAFDIRVIRHNIGVYLQCYWDCFLGAKLLNENEGAGNNGLKQLHNKYCLGGKADAFSFSDLFKGVDFALVPVTTAYVYAAHDSDITLEYYDFQSKYLRLDSEREDMRAIANVFFNIEMPCVEVVADMEDVGVDVDMEVAKTLHIKYTKMLEDSKADAEAEIENYRDKIDEYCAANSNAKIDKPLNISSPTQLAILLYDILKIDPVNKKNPRSTDEKTLEKIELPLCRKILDYRGIDKLISTYIDKIPDCRGKDGRVHCKFNQYGADTGRFSSSDPNLQNIPSHNKDIRPMFRATPGYAMLSSDFSQQEPKCLAALCKMHGDSQMFDTFMAGKDLYSEIASKAFNIPYEECKEFRPDGTTNKEGKARRTQAKSILLGVLYGRGVDSIAEQLNTTPEKAEEIKNSVFKGFPAIKKFEEDSIAMAKELGYVTTVCGRKRRLPDIQLPEYDFEYLNSDVNLLDFDNNDTSYKEVPYDLKNRYYKELKNCTRYRDKQAIIEKLYRQGIKVIDNDMKVSDAVRKTVNARIQGSAADLTKRAMIELHESARLKELGFRMLIQVHDEVIAECPLENVNECATLLAQTMSNAAEQILKMPIKCDVERTYSWYGEEVK